MTETEVVELAKKDAKDLAELIADFGAERIARLGWKECSGSSRGCVALKSAYVNAFIAALAANYVHRT